MELEQVKTRSLLNLRGLRNRAMMVISQDTKTDEFVMVVAKNIRRKWLLFNVPEAMWRGRGSQEEVLEESKRLLEETILAEGSG